MLSKRCLSAHSTCFYDGLKIYNLPVSSTAVATLCGSSVPGPISTFGPMLVHFYSDSISTDTGFMAEYTAIRKSDNEQLISSTEKQASETGTFHQ